jgi:hypothetical protein
MEKITRPPNIRQDQFMSAKDGFGTDGKRITTTASER